MSMQTYSITNDIIEIGGNPTSYLSDGIRLGGTSVGDSQIIVYPTKEELAVIKRIVPKENLFVQEVNDTFCRVLIGKSAVLQNEKENQIKNTSNISNFSKVKDTTTDEEEEDYNEEVEKWTKPYRHRQELNDEVEDTPDNAEASESEDMVTEASEELPVIEPTTSHLLDDLFNINDEITKLESAKASRQSSQKIYQNATTTFEDITDEVGLKRIELQQLRLSLIHI